MEYKTNGSEHLRIDDKKVVSVRLEGISSGIGIADDIHPRYLESINAGYTNCPKEEFEEAFNKVFLKIKEIVLILSILFLPLISKSQITVRSYPLRTSDSLRPSYIVTWTSSDFDGNYMKNNERRFCHRDSALKYYQILSTNKRDLIFISKYENNDFFIVRERYVSFVKFDSIMISKSRNK